MYKKRKKNLIFIIKNKMDNFDLKKYLIENQLNSENQKAKELVATFGKELAVKVVDEIQEIKSVYHDDTLYDYWEQIKQEIISYKSE
jgi:hypothetical protein